jgi:hypothetical protein
MVREINALLVRTTTVRFPNPKYQRDPVGFFREVLGIEPWERQIEMIEAVRDHMRVAICSGHKIGKSTMIAGMALWFYCSYADARAIMSSTTSRQVDQILWRELRMLRARSGRCVACKAADPEGFRIPKPCPHSAVIEGDEGELARTGLKSPDFREVVGFTAREAEAVAGISGRNLLYLLDEASGIPDVIYEAIEGNRAGGARIVLVGNGTRNEGEFFEAFYSKAHAYKTIRVSSETTPNVVRGEVVIPGLATRDWVDEKRREWGEDSALYKVRVKGEHAMHEEGKLFPLHLIGEAEKRWHETSDTGQLFIGLDPAGETGIGDESVYVARRGYKMLSLRAFKGLTVDDHLVHLLGMVRSLRLPRERVVVVVDREGPIGIKVARGLRAYADENPDVFELRTVRSSDGAPKTIASRDALEFDRVRDVLAESLRLWLKEGGAILEDVKLSRELHVLEFKTDIRGRLKLTPKEEIRKQLGRSPDRYDALALSVWQPRSAGADDSMKDPEPQPVAAADAYGGADTFDPYAGVQVWQKG